MRTRIGSVRRGLAVTAAGVARPSAQGHAMMRTATALTTANVHDGSGPKNPQTKNVPTANHPIWSSPISKPGIRYPPAVPNVELPTT